MAKLFITFDSSKADDALAGFPLYDEQFIDGSLTTYDYEAGTETLEIDLDTRDDTTAMQEQFLNTNDAVVKYEVR